MGHGAGWIAAACRAALVSSSRPSFSRIIPRARCMPSMLSVAALDSGQAFVRALVGFHGCLRDQARAVAIDAAHDRALVALEQHAAIVSKLAPFLQLLGPRRRLAFIPGQFERRESFALGELIDHHRLVGMDFGIAADDALTLDRSGGAQLQGRLHRVQGVGAAVAHHAAAKIPPAPPHHRVVAAVIGTLGGRAEPQIPVEIRRHRHALLGTVTQRLLAEDMLAGLHRCHRDHRVSVVGRGDEQLRRVVLLEVEARLRQFAAEAPASPEKRAGSVCRFHAVFARLCGTTPRQYRARLGGNGAPPMQAEEGDLPKNVRGNLSSTRSLLQESKPV